MIFPNCYGSIKQTKISELWTTMDLFDNGLLEEITNKEPKKLTFKEYIDLFRSSKFVNFMEFLTDYEKKEKEKNGTITSKNK